MIFNCLSCGKAISSFKDVCPYCKTDITELNQKLNRTHQPGVLKTKLKGTILSLVANR